MKSILIILLLSTTLIYSQEVRVFRTYENYTNDSAEVYDDYLGYFESFHKVTLTFKNGDKKVKIKCKDMWGFTYYGHLFRIAQRWNIPVKLVECKPGFGCTYENGFIWLGIAGTDKKFEDIHFNSDLFPFQERYHRSADINSDIQ